MGGKTQNFRRTLDSLMKENNFKLIREKTHLVWTHKKHGGRLVTSRSCRNPYSTIRNIKSEIRKNVEH